MAQATSQVTRQVLAQRLRAGTAPPRAAAYGTASELLASPHELDVLAALRARGPLAPSLARARPLDEAVGAALCEPGDALRDAYGALFEVGDEGPPVPIREDLFEERGAVVREEVARFYEHFGYRLADRFAWQPAHLSVQLEFLQLLCHREATAPDDDEARPYQLAQLDFTARHLARWLPGLGAAAQAAAPGAFYARALDSVWSFVQADLEWQRDTIRERGRNADPD